jgi:lysyl-tRNA synthetase class 2
MASLARLDPRNPKVAQRFEAYVDGMELCNGFAELVDPVEQRDRLERDQHTRRAAGLPVYPIDEAFLGALEEGLPPSGGNALGFDRLVMLVLGAPRIEDVVAIPSRRLD